MDASAGPVPGCSLCRTTFNPEEIIMKTRTLGWVPMLFLLSLTSAQAAPKITGVAASSAKVAVNDSVTFSVKGQELEDAICALKVDFGDGSSAVRKMDWGKKAVFPLHLKKQYARPGKYAVRVFGIKSGHYLKCLGSTRTSIEVQPAEPATKP
jgi:hypothetical protein